MYFWCKTIYDEVIGCEFDTVDQFMIYLNEALAYTDDDIIAITTTENGFIYPVFDES